MTHKRHVVIHSSILSLLSVKLLSFAPAEANLWLLPLFQICLLPHVTQNTKTGALLQIYAQGRGVNKDTEAFHAEGPPLQCSSLTSYSFTTELRRYFAKQYGKLTAAEPSHFTQRKQAGVEATQQTEKWQMGTVPTERRILVLFKTVTVEGKDRCKKKKKKQPTKQNIKEITSRTNEGRPAKTLNPDIRKTAAIFGL